MAKKPWHHVIGAADDFAPPVSGRRADLAQLTPEADIASPRGAGVAKSYANYGRTVAIPPTPWDGVTLIGKTVNILETPTWDEPRICTVQVGWTYDIPLLDELSTMWAGYATINWRVKQAAFSAQVDLRRGTRATILADWVQVSATAAIEENPQNTIFYVSAAVGEGDGGENSTTRTFAFLTSGTFFDTVKIPNFAKSFSFIHSPISAVYGGALQSMVVDVISAQQPTTFVTGSMGRYVAQGGVGLNRIELPASARYLVIDSRNTGGSPRCSVTFQLGL